MRDGNVSGNTTMGAGWGGFSLPMRDGNIL
jgi:hypothetical protein